VEETEVIWIGREFVKNVVHSLLMRTCAGFANTMGARLHHKGTL
jgi:hypothetical protein